MQKLEHLHVAPGIRYPLTDCDSLCVRSTTPQDPGELLPRLPWGVQKGRRGPSPTAKAVARLTSSKAVIRLATLAWLEQAGAHREPEYLSLTSHTELLALVKALREGPDVFPQVPAPWLRPSPHLRLLPVLGLETRRLNTVQATDLPATLIRALRVLAISPPNRSFILEAGALEPLTELLVAEPTGSIEPCLFAISLLAREEDARLVCFPRPALSRLLQLLSDPEATPEIRATAAATLTSLSRSLHNRQASPFSMEAPAICVWLDGIGSSLLGMP